MRSRGPLTTCLLICPNDMLFGRQSLPIRQFLLGNLYRPKGEDAQRFRVPLDILARSLDHLGDFPYADPSKRSFEKPALFVRGTKSRYITHEMLPTIKGFFPQFRLADIDAGHWLISEQPEAFRKGEVITRRTSVPRIV